MDELKESSYDIESFSKCDKGVEKNKCHLCDKEFDKNALEIHYLSCHNFKCESISKDHNEVQQKHKCHICDKFFDQLDVHFVSCHNFNCDLCEKIFTQEESLKGHIKSVHERLKNHKCDLCDKAFSRAEHLKTHINMVHEGLKKDFKNRNLPKKPTGSQNPVGF